LHGSAFRGWSRGFSDWGGTWVGCFGDFTRVSRISDCDFVVVGIWGSDGTAGKKRKEPQMTQMTQMTLKSGRIHFCFRLDLPIFRWFTFLLILIPAACHMRDLSVSSVPSVVYFSFF
jgi:hypothetical protein